MKNEIVSTSIRKFMKENFQLSSRGECSKEEYYKVFMRIGMILRPGIEADDLQRIITDDFNEDANDKKE